jgi:hypothetical protein
MSLIFGENFQRVTKQWATAHLLSLTPGFSRVRNAAKRFSRFNGLPAGGKPLKRFPSIPAAATGLKPGVNEIAVHIFANYLMDCPAHFENRQ